VGITGIRLNLKESPEENWEDYTEIAVGYDMLFQTVPEGSVLDLYRWYIQMYFCFF